MTEPIPQSKLDEWQQITEMATEGPWSVGKGHRTNVVRADWDLIDWVGTAGHRMNYDRLGEEPSVFTGQISSIPRKVWEADARFIAEARSIVPQLLDEVRRLQQLVNVMGDGLNVVSVCEFCGGES